MNLETMKAAKERVDQLIKPQGSLGKLEDIYIQLAGIQNTIFPSISKKALIVMCADHGVCEEGIASAPQSVTLMQTHNIAKGITGVGALAKQNHTKIYTVDIGVNACVNNPDIYHRKISYGSNNITKGPAMTYDQVKRAIEIGVEMADLAVSEGAQVLGTGEMGIGNTTPTTAILSALSGIDPKKITGIGANFPVEKLPHKAAVIQKALNANTVDIENPLDVLSKLGGYDIAGMTGVIIGASKNKVPMVLDGYICTVAAILACKLDPNVKQYLFASHASKEKGAELASNILGLKPFLDLDMRLGEGSGAVLAFNILESACYMNQEMITFEEAGIGVV